MTELPVCNMCGCPVDPDEGGYEPLFTPEKLLSPETRGAGRKAMREYFQGTVNLDTTADRVIEAAVGHLEKKETE